MGGESEVATLREAIETFDRAFAERRFEEFLETFADDARLLVHEEAPVRGLDAIRSAFRPVFEQIEAAEYRPQYEVVDVHGDRGYVLGSFDEVLRARGGTTGIRVRGRVVHFWRRLEGRWRIEMLLTGRSAPDEEV